MRKLEILSGYQARLDGRDLRLTWSQGVILTAIAAGRGSVVSPEELSDRVLGRGALYVPATLRAHVKRLRRVIGEGLRSVVLTASKGGYYLDPEIEVDFSGTSYREEVIEECRKAIEGFWDEVDGWEDLSKAGTGALHRALEVLEGLKRRKT